MAENLEKSLNQLEALLRREIVAHETLLSIMFRKRQAMQAASHEKMSQCTLEESAQVKLIADSEKQRLELVAHITLLLDPVAPAPMKMHDMAHRLPEPMRGRLLVLRMELRKRMEKVQQEAQVAKRACDALVNHVHGIIQMIGANCTGVSTYGQQGQPHKRATAVSTFNMTA